MITSTLTLLQVALGGAIGASARWALGAWLARHLPAGGFPISILCINVSGCFLMGLLVGWASLRFASSVLPFAAVGVLGGFTTFSAFSLEAVVLYERGAVGQAILYIVLSVGLSIAALLGGLYLARMIWA